MFAWDRCRERTDGQQTFTWQKCPLSWLRWQFQQVGVCGWVCVCELIKLYTLNSAVHCRAIMPQLSYKNISDVRISWCAGIFFKGQGELSSVRLGWPCNLSPGNSCKSKGVLHTIPSASSPPAGCMHWQRYGSGNNKRPPAPPRAVIRDVLHKTNHKVHSSWDRARAGNSLKDQLCLGPCFPDEDVVLVFGVSGRATVKSPAPKPVSLQPVHGTDRDHPHSYFQMSNYSDPPSADHCSQWRLQRGRHPDTNPLPSSASAPQQEWTAPPRGARPPDLGTLGWGLEV